MKQTTSHLMMIAPVNFGFNEEAFITNKFQQRPTDSALETQAKARDEFAKFVLLLRNKGVNVHVIEDSTHPHTPDSIFPNNWISTHSNGQLLTYPMAVSNRQLERRDDIIERLIEQFGYEHFDFSSMEKESQPRYLEGTGSMIFDHENKLVYVAVSPRSNESALNEIATHLGYTPIAFKSYGKTGELIYHTNVMMCVGHKFVIIGTNTIDEKDRAHVIEAIEKSGKVLIELNNDQVYDHFAGNMLQVQNDSGEHILVMSSTAFNSLTPSQKEQIELFNDHVIAPEIPTIEHVGGGSARCMLAEVFLPGS